MEGGHTSSQPSEDKEKALGVVLGGMADSSSLVISVAIGLLGILALYEFSSDLTSPAGILLSIGYWVIFLFGLQTFAFHQVNAIVAAKYLRDIPAYNNLNKITGKAARQLWFTQLVWSLYVPKSNKKSHDSTQKEIQDSSQSKDDDITITTKEKVVATMTIVFYFVVAFILWFAIAVL